MYYFFIIKQNDNKNKKTLNAYVQSLFVFEVV